MKFLLLVKWLAFCGLLLCFSLLALPLFCVFTLLDWKLTTEYLSDVESTIHVRVLNDFRGL